MSVAPLPQQSVEFISVVDGDWWWKCCESWRRSVKQCDGMIQPGFECGYVCVRVGALYRENLFHEVDDRLLLFRRHVRDGEVLPVVRVEVDVAAAIGAEEIAGGG